MTRIWRIKSDKKSVTICSIRVIDVLPFSFHSQMKRIFYIIIFFTFSFSLKSFGQKDTIIKFHNSGIDSVKMDYRFHRIHKETYYYQNGVRAGITKFKPFHKSIKIDFDVDGKIKYITRYRRFSNKIIMISWTFGHRHRDVLTSGHF
jgi:hypothetical protein